MLQHLEALVEVCQQLVQPLDLPWLDWPTRMQAVLILLSCMPCMQGTASKDEELS